MQPNETHTGKEDRSFTALLSDLTRELATLVRQEVQLTKAELTEKVSQAGSGASSLAVGGAISFAGFLVLLIAAVIGLNEIMEPISRTYPWLSPLIVGLIVLIIGFVLLQKGRSNLKAKNLTLHKTGESLRKDRQFVRDEVSR